MMLTYPNIQFTIPNPDLYKEDDVRSKKALKCVKHMGAAAVAFHKNRRNMLR